MKTYHHKKIKSFSLDGSIYDESAISRLKQEYIRFLILEMRAFGYVPRLDIEPDFTVQYNESKQIFNFCLTVYGVYTGKKSAEWILGVDGSKPIPIQKNKLKEYSQIQE